MGIKPYSCCFSGLRKTAHSPELCHLFIGWCCKINFPLKFPIQECWSSLLMGCWMIENTECLWTMFAVKLGNVKTEQLKLLPELCHLEGWYWGLFADQLQEKFPKKKDSRWTRISRPAAWRLLSTRVSWHLSFQVYSPITAAKESSGFIFLTFYWFFFQNEREISQMRFGKPPPKEEDKDLHYR